MKKASDSRRKYSVASYENGRLTSGEVDVVVEVPLTLFLNGREAVTLLTTGDHAEELAVGFFASEGFIQAVEDIKTATLDAKRQSVFVETRRETEGIQELFEKRIITSGCGKGSIYYHVLDSIQAGEVRVEAAIRIRCSDVLDMMSRLSKESSLYRDTRGVHGAALADESGEFEVFREDIGRHNAIDKIVGHCLLEGLDTTGRILLTTGRITSEVLIKASKMGVPVLVSRSAPTSLAIEMAERVGMTVAGYVRGGRMRVYSLQERITED